MDFPAPVSPVNTVRPFSNETDKLSMIAKFLIESSVNKLGHLTKLLEHVQEFAGNDLCIFLRTADN